ncbi:MAG TPA: hypothetical protein PLP61_13440 [Nocardioides sp.]|uniref:hypothetical protein n=1 Tax=Nocardioides sp. TaxID=35761 RepID=UPI002B5B9D06|nr:hypothetical protein [Nocardioides sp.]HQR28037.1 hypothetical protein [Nocardioides sp.]
MRPWLAALQQADAAEARGDAAGALRVITARFAGPDGAPFWRPERVRRLRQLTRFGPLLPRWATSRWIQAQALTWLDASSKRRAHRALETAVATRGGPGTLRGVDEADATCRVMDRDWVYRQVYLYELGGLAHFVARVAGPDLLAGADRIQGWTRAPLGGLRLLSEGERTIVWERLDGGEPVETANLGAALLLTPGECVLGRLVPTDDGPLFETAPLRVPETVAAGVAEDPASWLDALGHACRAPDALPGALTVVGEAALLTDVPQPVWDAWSLPGEPAALVRSVLAGALTDGEVAGTLPWLSAAFLEPGTVEELTRSCRQEEAAGVRCLAGRLAGPAGEVARLVAEALEGTGKDVA